MALRAWLAPALLLLALLLQPLPRAAAQPACTVAAVATLAGGGSAGGVGTGNANGVGSAATFKGPLDIALDNMGNAYVADTENNLIRAISVSSATVSTLAGNGSASFADGVGTAAAFNSPSGVAAYAGNVYVFDRSSNVVRNISVASQIVATLAGGGSPGGTASGRADGFGVYATFNAPYCGAIDSAGIIYVSDTFNNLIRTVGVATTAVATLAGSGSIGSANGVGTEATFSWPVGIAVDNAGKAYVADFNNNIIRAIVIATQTVSTLAGLAGDTGRANGVGTAASFNRPTGVAADTAGNVYVADNHNNLIRAIAVASQTVTTLAGGTSAGYTDGVGTVARFNSPYNLAVDQLGTIYVADQGNNLIRTVNACLSPSTSASASPSMSPSLTPSVSATVVVTMTPSVSASVMASVTGTVAASSSESGSESASVTASGSQSPTLSFSGTVSASVTGSVTGTVAASASVSGSESASVTASGSQSPTLSFSGTVSASVTGSVTGTVAASSSESGSESASVTASGSQSPTLSFSGTVSASVSGSVTGTIAASASE